MLTAKTPLQLLAWLFYGAAEDPNSGLPDGVASLLPSEPPLKPPLHRRRSLQINLVPAKIPEWVGGTGSSPTSFLHHFTLVAP